MNKLHIDLETYSEADLKAVGAWAYSKHPSTEILMLAWAFDDDDPAVWIPGDPEPEWMRVLYFYKHPAFKVTAWNDFFEFCILRNVLKWELPEPKYWQDTAAKAAALALPRSLDACGVASGLGVNAAKSKEGKNLIKIFCKPKVSMKKATRGQLIRTQPQDEPELFEEFKKYCIQDVIAERTIDKMLPDLQPRTRELWELDRAINLRGVCFDMPAVRNAIFTIDKAKEKAAKTVSDMTAGMLENISSRGQFLDYLQDLGVTLENAQKEYLKRKVKELKAEAFSMQLSRVIEAVKLIKLRLEISRSSLAKYDKLTRIIDNSHRGYGLLRFHGASTGRLAGNLFQPQNLPRKSLDLPDLCIELLEYRDPDIIELFFDNCLRAISLCLRGMITASPGNRLMVSDFAQIESRILAWLAGDIGKLEAYKNKLDIYKINAAAAFKIPYDDVDKEQRQIGKVIELACGYQGALGAFKEFSKVYEVVIPDSQAIKLISNWRNANPKITSYWTNAEAAAVKAVAEPGSIQKIRNVSYKVKGSGKTSFLFCYLPSGRRIAYHMPRLIEGKYGKYQIEYMGTNSLTKKYTRQYTYGGKLAENITQATAADCMFDKMIDVNNAGYPIVLTVHDELVTDVKKGKGSLEEFNSIMEKPIDWAEGLPIAADGYEAKRYKK